MIGDGQMSEKEQILFMQTRLIRLAAEKWNTSIQKADNIFFSYGVFKFIEDCYGLFHLEGDEAVFHEIEEYLKNREVDVYAELG